MHYDDCDYENEPNYPEVEECIKAAEDEVEKRRMELKKESLHKEMVDKLDIIKELNTLIEVLILHGGDGPGGPYFSEPEAVKTQMDKISSLIGVSWEWDIDNWYSEDTVPKFVEN